MNLKIDIETVKQQADCQTTAGKVGRFGGDNRSTKGLVYMHISTTNGHKTLGREGMYGMGGMVRYIQDNNFNNCFQAPLDAQHPSLQQGFLQKIIF